MTVSQVGKFLSCLPLSYCPVRGHLFTRLELIDLGQEITTPIYLMLNPTIRNKIDPTNNKKLPPIQYKQVDFCRLFAQQ